jgi:hypothetical protein
MPKYPLKQIRTLDPITKRYWFNVNKTYNILFGELDIRDGEQPIDALYRPLKGESYKETIDHITLNDGTNLQTISMVDLDNYPSGGVFFDFETMLDTELKVMYDTTSTVEITPGRASIFNMYFETSTPLTFHIDNTSSYLNPIVSTPTNETLVVLLGMLSPLIDTKVDVEIGLISVEDYVNWLDDTGTSDIQSTSLVLGMIELNEFGHIENENSILDSHRDVVNIYGIGPTEVEINRDILNGGFDLSVVNAGVVTETGPQLDW